MKRLENKVAIITGGNSGVGAATAKLFAEEGASVVISARRKEKLDDVANEIKSNGGKVLPVSADISKEEDADRVVEETIKEFGQLDILINSAGVLEDGLPPMAKVKTEDIDKIIDTNTKGTMYFMRAASQKMLENNSGSIVNVASVGGVYGNSGAAYTASKAAILGVTKHTALIYADKGIRANAVSPGTIETPMVSDLKPEDFDPDTANAIGKHGDSSLPVSSPLDIANILLFLASDESQAVTGQNIIADYGAFL